MNRNRKTVVYASKINFLSPQDCDSTLGYVITSRRRLNANMQLADCSRKIAWYFEGNDDDDDPIKKIDNILEIMNAFRADYLAASKRYHRRQRRKR